VPTQSPAHDTPTFMAQRIPFEVCGLNQNDRVFLNIEKDALRLNAGVVLQIEGVRHLRDAYANITGVSTNGSSSQLLVDSSLDQDLVLRSAGPRITINVEGSDNCSFQLRYRILAVGKLKNISSEDLCGVPQGCNYSASTGMLTFPYVPVREPFTHCVTARPTETVQYELRPDAIGLFGDDTLDVTVGTAARHNFSSKQTPQHRVLLSGGTGEPLCLRYSGNDTRSDFYVLFRKIVHKTVRVQDPEKDIEQGYERNTLVTWLFENGANNSQLNLVVRGASLNALQGDFLIIGSGDALQPLEGSPAAVLTSSVAPGTHLNFQVNGSDAYVVLFMGDRRDRQDKEDPVTPASRSLYMEWSRTGIRAEKSPGPSKDEAEKSELLWREALLLCVDVDSDAESVWEETKKVIRKNFANAANDYVKKRANPPDQKIEPHQVRLPDTSVVQSNSSWGFRVRLLVSVVHLEDPDRALLSSGELRTVFGNITNHLGRAKFSLSDDRSFWLTDRCKEAGDSVWWYLFAALSLAGWIAVFLVVWRCRSLYKHRKT
ncbi:unnamed protein product, partial [Ixodes hexagonus]